MLSNIECNDKLRQLRALNDRKTELNTQKTELQAQIDALNAELTEYFELNEVQNVKLEGHGTFYLNRTELPQIEDPEAVKVWLGERGDLDMLLSFNANKFRAYWKEQNEAGNVIPSVSSFIKTEIRMRRS